VTESQDQASATALSKMKLSQLQAIASQIGLRGVSRLRKGELIEAIKAHGQGKEERAKEQPRAKQEAPAESKNAGARAPRAAQGGASRRNAPAGRERSRAADSRGSESSAAAPTLDVLAEFEPETKAEPAKVASLDDIQLPRAEAEESTESNGRRRQRRDRRERNKRRPAQREAPAYEEVDVADGDVLIPIAGVLDVLDNYAFVRTTGYLPGGSDVYVNLGMVRRHGLRRGDAITGAVKQPREGETSSRQKFNALVAPEQVNNSPVAEAEERPDFDALTAIYPQTHASLGSLSAVGKAVEVLAPVALGQRVLVTAQPGAQRLRFLKDIAQGLATSHPHVHLMMVLIDERPEDATHMQRGIDGEVIASSFDRSGSDHTTVATLAVDRARRLVELGQDVIVILDSLTALARAYHTSTQPSSRVLEHGLDASTVEAVKQLFGAGRNIENGGSLTLIATGVAGTEAGDCLLRELRPAANSHIDLRPGELEAQVHPEDTYARNLEAIFDVEDLAARVVLRRLLGERADGAAWLSEQLQSTDAESFLTQSVKVTPREKAEIRRLFA